MRGESGGICRTMETCLRSKDCVRNGGTRFSGSPGGVALNSVPVFGSVARGEAHENSDLGPLAPGNRAGVGVTVHVGTEKSLHLVGARSDRAGGDAAVKDDPPRPDADQRQGKLGRNLSLGSGTSRAAATSDRQGKPSSMPHPATQPLEMYGEITYTTVEGLP